jgi:hypothetical protein
MLIGEVRVSIRVRVRVRVISRSGVRGRSRRRGRRVIERVRIHNCRLSINSTGIPITKPLEFRALSGLVFTVGVFGV